MERPAVKVPGQSVDAPSGTVKLEPAAAVRVRWLDAYSLEVVAERPLPRGEKVRVSLGDVRGVTGAPLRAPWHVTVIPRETVAGKVLGYSPKVGEPRVVAIHPYDGAKIGPRAELAILYDQPMDLVKVQSLLALQAKGEKPVPLLLSHPPGPTFQGVAVDRRFVVLLRPTAPLVRGKEFSLRVKAAYAGGSDVLRSLAVAEPLEVVRVECPYHWDHSCAVDGSAVETKGDELAILVNNSLSMRSEELERLVKVSPAVSGLSVYSYGEAEGARIVVRGAFEASKHYDISLVGLVDRHGSRLDKPFHASLDRAAVDASVTMPSGVLLLDDVRMRRFQISSRNASEAVLSLWPVAEGELGRAVKLVRDGQALPAEAPTEVSVPIKAAANKLVTTEVDLTRSLDVKKQYIAAIRVKKTAFDADPPGEMGPSPRALLFPGSAESLAVHVEKLPARTLVHVAKLGTGEALSGAAVELLGESSQRVTTGADGLALLGAGAEGVLSVSSGSARAVVELGRPDTWAAKLFPSLADGDDAPADAPRAVVFTDRGIYRPGATVELFASVRGAEGDRLAPLKDKAVVVRALGPSGEEVFRSARLTDEMGGVAASIVIPKGAKLGRHRLIVEEPGEEGRVIADEIVQVADFEPPRFAVDVDASASDERSLRASVRARYLFGAPMSGAEITWTARREAAAIAQGPFAGAGLSFRPAFSEWGDHGKVEPWARSGEMKAAADGTAAIEQRLSLQGTFGPQRFVVEAQVSDSSHRAIAGRASAIVHPAKRYAGLRLGKRWAAPRERVPVELAVVDRDGKAVVGAAVSAALRRVEYRSISRRDAGGALSEDWTRTVTTLGRCGATSAEKVVTCDLALPEEGSYEIAAEVDGRPGGTVSLWAWGGSGGGEGLRVPSRGRAIDLVADKGAYAPGEKAKLFVASPFAAATAIITTDAPGDRPRAQRIDGSAGVVEVPLSAAGAPHVNAMVTLLPLAPKGGAGADYRIGAARLPVSLSGARLGLEVTPAKASYGPREEAEIAIRVMDGAAPAAGAQVAIAVVDEGVLRMTGYRAPDPVSALRPGRGLSADVFDTRAALGDLIAQSHVAGDGDSGKPSTRGRGEDDRSMTSARKTFVETAFWKSDVRTDKDGRASVRFTLPDNLTEFRVTAMALDRDGKGASREGSFTVSKPILLSPAVPRFVSLGDTFEAAALVHSTLERGKAEAASRKVFVAFEGRRREVALAPGGQARAGFLVRVTCDKDAGPDEVALCPTSKGGEPAAIRVGFEALAEDGTRLDAVELAIPATFAGIDERPHLDGAFVKSRKVSLRVPAHVTAADGGGALTLSLGAQMWPELGERLRYLLDYPHGCVEQTTSSTLPLLAARDLAPRLGMENVSDADLRAKIRAGIERLATMRTSSGGLAYWPGGSEPNTYGTAYAIRALVLARASGIEPPKALLDGMADYLKERMFANGTEPEVMAAIAQSLAELGRLEASASDALFDRRSEQSVFGAASLAMALSALPGQKDRVEALLDKVEAGFDEAGQLRDGPRSNDFYYYGSPQRTKSQAAMALRKLRPTSALLPRLVRALAAGTERYTTQATAYSLLALAAEVRGLARGAASARVLLDGREVEVSRELDGGGRQYEIPLASLAGKEAELELQSDSSEAVGFLLRARWRRPAEEGGGAAYHTASGPSVYRMYTDPKGAPVDLDKVKAGDVLRVALIARRPAGVDPERYGYIAITDRLPAGFEPVQTDLATVAAQPDVTDAHPFAAWLRGGDERASFVELHDDRVNVYFDAAEGDDVAASYLVRATTPGRFAVPPATAELMYEPDSLGASEPLKVAVR